MTTTILRIVGTVCTVGIAVLLAAASINPDTCESTQTCEQERAFLSALTIAGRQHLAVAIGRTAPEHYLALLRQVEDAPLPLVKLVEGDLWLALGQKQKGLACYRVAAGCATETLDQGDASGQIPADSYLVEPQPPSLPLSAHSVRANEPFADGPGSHRDNWLVRRFIALEAWDDAASELARVWQIHRRNARPYRVLIPTFEDGEMVGEQEGLLEPAGFNSRGLQFALDYAFFLKQQGRLEQALTVLREPMLMIDLDRNPNQVAARPITPGVEVGKLPLRSQLRLAGTHSILGSAGVSRKEFIRLVWGSYKEAGRESSLVDLLQEQIDAGNNRLRRVLARARYHQGRADDVVALELAYIDCIKPKPDPLTAAYRRARVWEEAGKPAAAIAAYEQVLELPYSSPMLPDADEEAVQAAMMRQQISIRHRLGAEVGRAQLVTEVIGRLQRLYGALGQPDKVLELALRQIEGEPSLLTDIELLERTGTRAEALGRREQFHGWLRRQLALAESRTTQAGILWALDDHAGCVRALAQSWRDGAGHDIASWWQRFHRAGDEALRRFLLAVVEYDPDNARARLELLDLQGGDQGEQMVQALEALLKTDARFAFAIGKGVYNRTRFRSYFDLAYRLMRHYQQAGQIADLQQLGLRIAAGDQPFGTWWREDPEQYRYRDGNGLPEDLNACLALLLQHADQPLLDQLQTLWHDLPDHPGKRQLIRRLAGSFAVSEPEQDLGWANLPAGVRLIVSGENVLSLACDDRYIYAGQPWGITVYELSGRPVTRIALGEAALALAVDASRVWVGTPRGLFRIRLDGWTVAHLWLHQDVPETDRHARSFPGPGAEAFDNSVSTLTLDGDQLWIGLHRNLQRLDTRTMTLRAYSYRELGLESWAGFEQIVPDGEYVWAVGSAGLLRYERRTDSWYPVEYDGRRVGLIGIIDGRLLGHVSLDDELRDRPCLIDRKSLHVTPILIEGDLSRSERQLNGPFCYFGTARGELVFGDGHPAFVLDQQSLKLRKLGAPGQPPSQDFESLLPAQLPAGVLQWHGDPVQWQRMAEDERPVLSVRERDRGYWSMLLLPDGRTIVGQRSKRTRYQYPQEEWPFTDIVHERQESAGGLRMIAADGSEQRLSGLAHGDAIPGDVIFDLVSRRDSDQVWLCTDLGLAWLDGQDRVRARLTRSHGLTANRVTSGIAIGERLLFTTAWGDHGGGLVVADPSTALLSAYFQSDGLATDKLARIESAGDTLRLIYDIEYGRGAAYSYRHFPPGSFDPSSEQIDSRREPRYLSQSEAAAIIVEQNGRPEALTPVLGGFLIGEHRIGDRIYRYGTRGLVIQTAEPLAKPLVEQLRVQVIADPYLKLQAEAGGISLRLDHAHDFVRSAGHHNPFVRERVLASAQHWLSRAPELVVPVLVEMVADSHLPNRRAAVRLLGQSGDASIVPRLQPALADPDAQVRRNAALALAELGARPAIEVFEQIFDHGGRGHDSYSDLPLIRVLAGQADREVFELLLKYPLVADDYEDRQAVFRELGASLRQHPECSELLLAAYMKNDPGPQSSWGAPRCAQEVFRHAGATMLPRLHRALTSTDRVIRANAARACGAIGEPSSIPHLIAALELESGLSRASIVWALGELKAKQALPHLATLYTDARNDQQRRRGAGYRIAQANAQLASQYQTLSSLDAIAASWDELQQVAAPAPIDPSNDEPLLEPRMILEAVRRIGPESSQELYRKLAAATDPEARQEAAERLSEGAPADLERNRPILRILLGDQEVGVRMRAAVSLLMLGEVDVRRQILAWLGSSERGQPYRIVLCLERVPDGELLLFARASLLELQTEPGLGSYQQDRLRSLLSRIPDP